jgi:hypothetical protein
MVRAETVDALLKSGEPMVTDSRDGDWDSRNGYPFRCWIRFRDGGRMFGTPAGSVQSAADYLLDKLRGPS